MIRPEVKVPSRGELFESIAELKLRVRDQLGTLLEEEGQFVGSFPAAEDPKQ
jgi:hypothetical protein